MRGQERREGWEARRAEGLLHDSANVVGILPATSRPPLMFEPPRKKPQKCGKNQEKCTFEQSAHCVVALGSAITGTKHRGTTKDRQRSCNIGPTTAKKNTENATKLTAHSSHDCPRIIKNTSKSLENRQIDVQILQKSHENTAKTTIFRPKLTKRGLYVSEKFEQARIKDFI